MLYCIRIKRMKTRISTSFLNSTLTTHKVQKILHLNDILFIKRSLAPYYRLSIPEPSSQLLVKLLIINRKSLHIYYQL